MQAKGMPADDSEFKEIVAGRTLTVLRHPNSGLAPLRKTSVCGSENVPGWVSAKTLVSVTAYRFLSLSNLD
jgi:hypothetical protein